MKDVNSQNTENNGKPTYLPKTYLTSDSFSPILLPTPSNITNKILYPIKKLCKNKNATKPPATKINTEQEQNLKTSNNKLVFLVIGASKNQYHLPYHYGKVEIYCVDLKNHLNNQKLTKNQN